MSISGLCIVLGLFQIKHFFIDFVFQPPWMWQNKGTYGHLGGIVHAGLHGVVTVPILLLAEVNPTLIAILALSEFLAHYHIDWAKMNINAKMGWKSNTHNQFWILTGLDQLLHQLTYLAIVWIAFK